MRNEKEQAEILAQLKKLPGVEYVAALDDAGRHQLRVAREQVVAGAPTCLRAQDPEAKVLKAVAENTTGPTYPLVCYVTIQLAKLILVLIDGHQRFKTWHTPQVEVQVNLAIESEEEAVDLGLQLGWARVQHSEADLISVMTKVRLSRSQIAARTGISDSTLRRLELIANNQWVMPIVESQAVKTYILAKLIKACGENELVKAALRKTLLIRFDKAQREAQKMQTQIDRNKGKKWPREAYARTKPSFYFKSINWDAWEAAINQCDITSTGHLGVLGVGGHVGVIWGTREDWEKELAIKGLFGQRWDSIATDDIAQLVKECETIKAHAQLQLATRKTNELDESNELDDDPAPEKLGPQPDDFDTDTETDTDTDTK